MKRRQLIIRILSYIFLITASLVMIYPVLYMFLGSFTTQDQFLETRFLPIPNTWNVDLFERAFKSGVGRSYLFTLTRVCFYIAVNLMVGLIAGYIFSKLKFPGKNRLFLLFLLGMVMPGILMLIPMYLMMARFPLAGGNNIFGLGGSGFIGTAMSLFIYGWVPPFAIFLFKQSYDMMPTEYEDAAKMDGAGMFTIIFRIYAPLLKPAIVAIVIVTSLGIWNDYLWPSMVVGGHPELYPIAYQVQYVQLVEGSLSTFITHYPSLMIRTLLATWPPAVLYFALQRYFVQGLVASGLKG